MTELVRRRCAACGRNEQGSIIVAMSVLLVLSTLSLGLLARTLTQLHSVRQGQDFSAALANADAGISDAMFRIDQQGKSSASAFCVGPSPCTLSSVPGAPGVSYTARATDANTYTVLSKGYVNRQPHAVEATVQRAADFPFALFAFAASFNGNISSPITTLNADGTVDTSVAAAVGTGNDPSHHLNGSLLCSNGSSPGQADQYYPPANISCGNQQVLTTNYDPQNPVASCPAPANTPPTPCVPADPEDCPLSAGKLESSVQPGVYLCTQTSLAAYGDTLTFPSTVTVGAGAGNNGEVQIYMIPTDSSTLTLDMRGSTVNSGGDPTKFQVYMANGAIPKTSGSSDAWNFTGILYAPWAQFTGDGCKDVWRGAVVLNAFTCNGSPNLSIFYDARMDTYSSTGWKEYNYSEIPSSQVTFP
ncbi:MAG TPA: hypothetical protein VFH45_05200 [Acidimicrobiales bacterium]|nr:hypothetical protein [Acidimicrobiales bacterium]